MALNIATGEWEDDEHPLGGDIGEQSGSPFNPMPPPPTQAPGPEMMVQPPDVLPAPVPQLAQPQPPGMPQLPNVEPYTPGAVAPIPQGRVVSPAEAANLGAIDKNTAARTETAQDAGGVGAVGKVAYAQDAERQQFLADAKRQEHQRIADEATRRIQERQQQANADYEAFKKFGIKDPEADDNFVTKILKAILVGLGGFAAARNGGPNGALEVITAANRDNINRQKAQQEKLFQVSQKSGKDVGEAQTQRDDAFKQLDLKHAALLDSSAGMLRSELARLGIPQAQIDANKDIQKIEAEALGVREKTLASIRDDETSLARADIAASSRRHKAGAGGVAGDAMGKFAERAGALQPGEQIPPDLVVLGARAGLKPNQIAAEVDRYRGSGAKSLKGAGAEDKAVNDRMNKYEAQAVGTARTMGPVRVLSQIEAMRHGLDEAVASGDSDRIKAAAIKAKEQAGTIMSGGKLTNAQIKILHDLESSVDQMTATIGKFTGNPTEGKGAVRRLTYLIDNAGEETAQQIGDIRQRGVNEHLGPNGLANTEEAKRTFLNRNKGLYSEVKWKGKRLFDEGGGGGDAGNDRKSRAQAVVGDPANRKKYSDAEWALLQSMARGP